MTIITPASALLAFIFFSLSAQALHSSAGIPSGTTLKTVSPMVISGKKDVVIRGVRISNPRGSCILINNGSQNILIENSEIGPCAAFGVDIRGSAIVKVQNSYLHDIKNTAVGTYNVTGLHVYNNRIERYMKGVYSVSSTKTVVRHNAFKDINSSSSLRHAKAIQFNKVIGTGNRINCNVVENTPGKTNSHEIFNLYRSQGTAADPIQIMSNKIKGGGPDKTGTGIIPTDHGSSYVLVKGNILVDPGAHGLTISAGHHIEMVDNLIYAKKQPFTWTGISIRNQLKSQGYVCYGHTVSGNLVNWTSKGGKPNPYINNGTCGTIAGFNTNTWNASIGPSIWNLGRSACKTL